MAENIPTRPKLSGSLASSLRQRSVSTQSAPVRSLPNLPDITPVKAPVPPAPRATATNTARSLPAIPTRIAAPVITEKQPVTPPVQKPKVNPNRSAAAKKRNRGPVITRRDMALLKFLIRVNCATAQLISQALYAFEYKDVKTGELKPASVHGIMARLTVLRKQKLVDYKNNGKGTTIWFPLWDAFDVTGEPFPDNRPRHQRINEAPKPQKARLAPKESKWAHTLGLAALIIDYKRKGYRFITDDQMLSASEQMRALDKGSKGYVPDSDLRRDPSFTDINQFSEHAEYFTFPNLEGGSHRPDLVVAKPGEGIIAVELELNRKNTKEIISNFGGLALALKAGRFDSAIYYTDPKIETFVCRYKNEAADRLPALRQFFECISIETYIAEDWKAAVPQM